MHICLPQGENGRIDADAQFPPNPKTKLDLCNQTEAELLKVIRLLRFTCNTEHFLRKREVERKEVGNEPMFFLLSPSGGLEGISHKF